MTFNIEPVTFLWFETEKEDEETFRMEMSGLLNELGIVIDHRVCYPHLAHFPNFQYVLLFITGCPHSQLLGVNGLASQANRLLLLGNFS